MSDVLRVLGRTTESLTAAQEAVRISPDLPNGWVNLANAYLATQQLDLAIEAYQRAIKLSPKDPLPHANLGIALQRAARFDEAVASHQAALELDSSHIPANLGMAGVLLDLGRPTEAVHYFHRVLQFDPSNADAHAGLGYALLQTGKLEEGWPEYEWRWETANFPSPRHNLPQPYWRGEPIEGRTILLHAEQGFGDTIQFARYIPLVAARGAKVILLCQRELVTLLAKVPGVEQVITDGDQWPDFDLQLPLASLPAIFQTSLTTIPGGNSYLHGGEASIQHFKERLQAMAPGPRIGLVWAANPNFTGDALRSTTLEEWAPLAEIEGLTFISLQKDVGPDQVSHSPFGPRLIPLGHELATFHDTSAALANLDLLITVDTSIAHLAGATGTNAWVLLPFAADWRWLQKRSDSPWYPSLRLFRRPSPKDTGSAVQQIASDLRGWLASEYKTPRS